jgi:exonuclease SbcD
MRIMHLADLHLGKIFHDVHLTEDQADILDQIV